MHPLDPVRRAAAAALLLTAAVVPAAAAATGPPATAVVGAVSPRAAQAVATELRAEGLRVEAIPHIAALAVSGDALPGLRRLVGGDPRVDWVEPPRERTLFVAPQAIDTATGRPYGWAVDSVNASGGLAQLPGARLPVTVAVVDSGVDVGHPDLAGRIGPTYDVLTGGTGVKDAVGHGTFVAGLISAIDGNDLGGRGVAGATTVLPIRVTTTGMIKSVDSAAAIVRAVDSGAGVINLSFGGATLAEVERSALAYAAARDVLVVAASGNGYLAGNAVQYPAAALGGARGSWGPGLSVAATDPLGRHAPFSTANDFVSVAAPGAGAGACGDGVFSTIPGAAASLWDDNLGGCTRVVGALGTPAGRYGYGEGTSFATPLVAGAAALARDANPDLTAEQTADVIRRSAHQTAGSGWNPQTGVGVLDVGAAVALARAYDTAPPVPVLTVTRAQGAVSVSLAGHDTAGPQALESGVAVHHLERSTDGATYATVAADRPTLIRFDEALPAGQRRWYRGTVCDADHNCASALSGPVAAAAAAPPAVSRAAAGLPPAVRTLAAGRPGTCRRCVRVTFAAQGAGPLKWAVALTPAARVGVKPIRRTGAVPASGRVIALIPLSRIPACRGRLALSIRVTSPFGTTHSGRTLTVNGACRPPIRR